jgi:quaternary ammonium compound-resistance protein SugE
MAWLLLVFSGLCEPVWSYFLKESHGFTKLLPAGITLLVSGLSFVALSFALKSLPLGPGYAVWTGIGTVGTTVMGLLLLGEPMTIIRFLCLVAIIGGAIGLRLTASN